MARAVIFFEFEVIDVRFGSSVPKDIKMGGVAIALPKKRRSQAGLPFHYPLHMIVSIFSPLISPDLIKILMFVSKSFYF